MKESPEFTHQGRTLCFLSITKITDRSIFVGFFPDGIPLQQKMHDFSSEVIIMMS